MRERDIFKQNLIKSHIYNLSLKLEKLYASTQISLVDIPIVDIG